MTEPTQDQVPGDKDFFMGTLITHAPNPMPPLEASAHVWFHVEVLRALKMRLREQEEASAPFLRAYVTDKSNPLAARFKVWSEWCKKIVHPWVINEEKAGVIGKIVEHRMVEFDRYRLYTWSDMLDVCENEEATGMTYEEAQEALIETNFGSFYMDW